MFDIFGRKRIKKLERELAIKQQLADMYKASSISVANQHIEAEFKLEMQVEEIKGYKDQIERLHKLLNFVTVNKAAKRRNDVLLASIACGFTTPAPILRYLNSKGIKDPDGGDYKKSTVYDIIKGATI